MYAEKDMTWVPISNRAFSKENKYSLLFPQGPFAVAICLNKMTKIVQNNWIYNNLMSYPKTKNVS